MAFSHIRLFVVYFGFVGFCFEFSDAHPQGFLAGQSLLNANDEEDFRAAMGTVMGCGGSVEREKLVLVEESLAPMWRALPKREDNLVEWRMVRYVAHRYFMKKSNILIRGFEPMQQLNVSYFGAADILHKHVPALVQKTLQTKHSTRGFALEDVVALVATLEQLISDDESTLLEHVYKQQGKSWKETLSEQEFLKLVEAYMVHWLIHDDATIKVLLAKPLLLHKAFPKWNDIKQFVHGLVKSMQFTYRHSPSKGASKAALLQQFSFDNAHEVVSAITERFASFWESECQHIKESLVALDKGKTGRIRLSDFYGANVDGEWRFAESEAYLRELGALDESSRWLGKQVIISNYVQGANNCIASTPHYLVCCVNECEEVLNSIEDALGGPVGAVHDIVSLVNSFTDMDDAPPKIDSSLLTQLDRIAEIHNGKIPIHGRLFSQWLHYVFPRECPFPHRAGVATTATPTQFGESSLASKEEVGGHAVARNDHSSLESAYEDVQSMAEWSEDEELMDFNAPWDRRSLASPIFAIIIVLAFVGQAMHRHSEKGNGCFGVCEQKAHFV